MLISMPTSPPALLGVVAYLHPGVAGRLRGVGDSMAEPAAVLLGFPPLSRMPGTCAWGCKHICMLACQTMETHGTPGHAMQPEWLCHLSALPSGEPRVSSCSFLTHGASTALPMPSPSLTSSHSRKESPVSLAKSNARFSERCTPTLRLRTPCCGANACGGHNSLTFPPC